MKTVLLSTLILFICMVGAKAQAPSPSPQASSTPSEVSLQQYREILEHERKLMEEQSEKYYGRIDTLINRSLWVFGTIGGLALLLLAGAAALFIRQYGRTKSEMKTAVREQFKEQAASLIDEEMTALRNQVQSLNQQVQELQAANNKPILWVFSGTEVESGQEREAFVERGIGSVTLLTPAVNEDFDIGDPSLVIFSYDRSGEGQRRLRIIADALREKSPPVSLIIYTYAPNRNEFRIDEPERRVLGDFMWYLPVNYPVTLIAQTQLLLRGIRSA